MNEFEKMQRRLAEINRSFERFCRPMLTEAEAALVLADALTNAIGLSSVRSRGAKSPQSKLARYRAGGQAVAAAAAVQDGMVAFDLGIVSAISGSPGSAWPACGRFSGRLDANIQEAEQFRNEFFRRAIYRASEQEAWHYIRFLFRWSGEQEMGKLTNVNVDERNPPLGVKPRVFREAAALVEGLLEKLEVRGQFLLKLREQKQMRHGRGVRLLRQVGQSIRMRIRPGDNGTCWDYDLLSPQTQDVKLLYDRLAMELGGVAAGEADEDDAPVAASPNRNGTHDKAPAPPPTRTTPTAAQPTVAPPATVTAPATGDVLQLLSGAMARRERRQTELNRLEAERKRLENERRRIEAAIAEIEEEQTALLAEDESDAQAQAVSQMLESFGKILAGHNLTT